jgi:CheY-specific phosphatase CheX
VGVKFFGQYLLEKNIIKPHELIEAVEYQNLKNLFFGEYAISKGYLTQEDVERIKNEQRHLDMKFGEIAVRLGLLTPAQVEEILTMQKNDHVFIGEALVEKGFLTRDVLERELRLFKEDQKRYLTGNIIIPPGVRHPEIVREMVSITQKMLQRLSHLNIKINHGFIGNIEPKRNFLLISVILHGSAHYEYAFSTSQEMSRLIASAFINVDPQNEQTEILSDGVREFCNITCGNIIARLALQGKKMDINPPEEIVFSDDGYHLVRGRKAIYYPLISPVGESILILIEE